MWDRRHTPLSGFTNMVRWGQGYNPNYKIDLEAYNEHKRELGLLYIDDRVDVPDLVYREDEISDAPYPGINAFISVRLSREYILRR